MASWAEVTATDKPSSQGVPDQYTLTQQQQQQQQQQQAPKLLNNAAAHASTSTPMPASHASPTPRAPTTRRTTARPKPAQQPITTPIYTLPPDVAGQLLRCPLADKALTFTLFAPIAHAQGASTQSLREAFQTGLQQALRSVSELHASGSNSTPLPHLPPPSDIPLPSCHFWQAGQPQGLPANWGLFTFRLGLPSEQADALRTALTSTDHMGMVFLDVPGRGQCTAQLHTNSNTPGPAGSISLIKVEFDQVTSTELAITILSLTRAFSRIYWVHKTSELPRLPPAALNGAARHALFALVEGGTRQLKARRATLDLNANTPNAKSHVLTERVLLSLPAAPQPTTPPPAAPDSPSAIPKKRSREEQQQQQLQEQQQQQAPTPPQTAPLPQPAQATSLTAPTPPTNPSPDPQSSPMETQQVNEPPAQTTHNPTPSAEPTTASPPPLSPATSTPPTHPSPNPQASQPETQQVSEPPAQTTHIPTPPTEPTTLPSPSLPPATSTPPTHPSPIPQAPQSGDQQASMPPAQTTHPSPSEAWQVSPQKKKSRGANQANPPATPAPHPPNPYPISTSNEFTLLSTPNPPPTSATSQTTNPDPHPPSPHPDTNPMEVSEGLSDDQADEDEILHTCDSTGGSPKPKDGDDTWEDPFFAARLAAAVLNPHPQPPSVAAAMAAQLNTPPPPPAAQEPRGDPTTQE